MLSFNDVLAVTPGISPSTIIAQRVSHKGGEAASHRSAVHVQITRRSRLPRIVLCCSKSGSGAASHLSPYLPG